MEIDLKDLQVEIYRGSDLIQENPVAVRITHIPTGVSAFSEKEKGTHKNRVKALKILKEKLNGPL